MYEPSSDRSETGRAADYLDRLLGRAVEAGADTVELERVPDGLEITFCSGGAGVGFILMDRELESELIELIVRRAGLEHRAKGRMIWNIHGDNRAITVEEYNRFGESCFRLKFSQAKIKSP